MLALAPVAHPSDLLLNSIEPNDAIYIVRRAPGYVSFGAVIDHEWTDLTSDIAALFDLSTNDSDDIRAAGGLFSDNVAIAENIANSLAYALYSDRADDEEADPDDFLFSIIWI